MSIVRTEHNKDNPYVLLNKKALEDKNISWAAKGLWSYLMSRPNDWEVSVAHLCKIYSGKGGGERAIYSLLHELIGFGYCSKTQKFNAKGQFEKLEYVITEFKKCLPLRSKADAVEAGTLKSATTIYRSIPSKEERQQQEPAGGAVVFYECIREIGLSEKEQKSLMKYPEEEVKEAVFFVTRTEFEIKTTLIKALIWAIKEKPELSKPVDSNKNFKIAELAELTLESRGWNLEALGERVIINCKSPTNSTEHQIEYDSPNFEKNLKQLLQQHQFKKRGK